MRPYPWDLSTGSVTRPCLIPGCGGVAEGKSFRSGLCSVHHRLLPSEAVDFLAKTYKLDLGGGAVWSTKYANSRLFSQRKKFLGWLKAELPPPYLGAWLSLLAYQRIQQDNMHEAFRVARRRVQKEPERAEEQQNWLQSVYRRRLDQVAEKQGYPNWDAMCLDQFPLDCRFPDFELLRYKL